MVIASLPVPSTVNTLLSTSAVTAALAMPGKARAAATATPAIGIEFFHFADTRSSWSWERPQGRRACGFIPQYSWYVRQTLYIPYTASPIRPNQSIAPSPPSSHSFDVAMIAKPASATAP